MIIASPLPAQSLVPDLTTPILAFLESPLTICTDSSEFKTAIARVVTPTRYSVTPVSSDLLLASLHWLPIRQRVTSKLACLVYRSLRGTSPTYLSSLLQACTPTRPLRSSSADLLIEPRLRTTLGSRGFRSVMGPRIWNSLPNSIKLAPSYTAFRSKLKTHLFPSFR